MRFIRIIFVVLMAVTMVAWVAGEDVRESDAAFERCEMLQGARFEVPSQRTVPVERTSSLATQYKVGNPASADASTPLTMLSSCILRC